MTIVAIDTETGGLDPSRNPLLSVSLVELDADLQPTRSLDVFVQPWKGSVITPEAVKVNGYTPELWEQRGAVPVLDALQTIAKWLPRWTDPLAHNAVFDRGFLDASASFAGVRLNLGYRWRCSMVSMMAVNDALGLGFKDCKLDTLARACGHWGIDYQRGDHQAQADVLACAVGYRWLIEKIRTGAQRQAAMGATTP